MQYIEAISKAKIEYTPTIFLAGGISNCYDWQQESLPYLQDLPITVINPRRKNFDVLKEAETVKQIKWEYQRLNQATHILFWFPKETVCPITLFELGAALQRHQVLIIGCHPEYQRLIDVKVQTRLTGHYDPIYTDFHKMMRFTNRHLDRLCKGIL